jgi:hypothetical protein
MVAAETALGAVTDAVASGKVIPLYLPNSLYREGEDSDVSEARIRRFDLGKLVYFRVSRCAERWRRNKCAEFLFDHGRGDRGVENIEVEIGGSALRTAADVKAIRISQFVLPQ